MGMFDWVKVEDDSFLPKPENFGIDIKELDFQTKSLDNALYTYVIGKDKKLYRKDGFERDSETKQIDYHGFIEFGGYHATDIVDYIADYRAKFTDGTLQEITLERSEKNEHESTKKKMEEHARKFKRRQNHPLRKIALFLQNIIVFPLNMFGMDVHSGNIGTFRGKNFVMELCFPRVILGYGNLMEGKTYGISLDKLTTEACLRKTPIATNLSLKFLGIGIVVSLFKKLPAFGETNG